MFLEALEPRQMLAISAQLNGNQATFVGDGADDQPAQIAIAEVGHAGCADDRSVIGAGREQLG